MARPRPIPDLSAGQPYASAAAKAIATRAAELTEHSDGVLDMEDIERLHDMRVATRRLRAALEIFEPCFPPKRFKGALVEVKEMADALGERRDRDVAIAALEEFAAEIPAEERRGVESLIGSLRGEQQDANRVLVQAVGEDRLRGLATKVAGLVAAAERRGA